MMNLKTLAAAGMIAFLPATSFAAITINTEGNDGVQAHSVAGPAASTGDTTGGTSTLFLGPAQALDWTMRVINLNGFIDSAGEATYRFTVGQAATISVTSTQNPFAGLDNLMMSLTVGAGAPQDVGYTSGAFAQIVNVSVAKDEIFTIKAAWDSITNLETEVAATFVLQAAADPGPGEIPLPATALLLIGALGGLGYVARKRS